MKFGDIVYFKNIIFKNEDGSHEIDPYFSIGRPCVCIGEYGDDMYFLPLTRIDNRREEKFFDILSAVENVPDHEHQIYSERKTKMASLSLQKIKKV